MSYDALLQRNADFADGFGHGDLTARPRLGVIVLTCVDPRVSPAHFLQLEVGDAMVLRTPAGRLTPSVLRSLAVVAVVGQRTPGEPDGPPHLLIVHHTDCGVGKLTTPGDEHLLAPLFEIDPDAVADQRIGDPFAAVALDVGIANEVLAAADLVVSGHVYDVTTGRLETVVAPAPTGS